MRAEHGVANSVQETSYTDDLEDALIDRYISIWHHIESHTQCMLPGGQEKVSNYSSNTLIINKKRKS